MLELCLGALNPCSHVMLSQRSRLKDIDPFGRAAEKFLSLTPRCCSAFTSLDSQTNSLPSTVSSVSSICDRHGCTTSDFMKSLPASINYGTRLSDSLYGNYHAYLCDARQKIKTCRIACSNWSCQYDGNLRRNTNTNSMTTLTDENIVSYQSQKKAESRTLEIIKNAIKSCENDDNIPLDNILFNIQSLLEGKDLNSNEHNVKNELNTDITLSFDEQAQLDADIAELLNESIGMTELDTGETCLDKKESDSCMDDSTTAMNSLMSLGESSGYESFAFKGSPESTPDNETSEDRMNEEHEEAHIVIKKEMDDVSVHNVAESNTPITGIVETSSSKLNKDTLYRQDVFNGQPNVGIFLDVVLRKLECMTSNNLYVNLHLTGLISRLAIYPQPLLQSFLLNHSLVFQPSIRSLFQVYIY